MELRALGNLGRRFDARKLHRSLQRLVTPADVRSKLGIYKGCLNMNASRFITFFTYMLRQHGKRFYNGLYVTFKLAPVLKKNTVYLSSYSPLNEGQVSILRSPIKVKS